MSKAYHIYYSDMAAANHCFVTVHMLAPRIGNKAEIRLLYNCKVHAKSVLKANDSIARQQFTFSDTSGAHVR